MARGSDIFVFVFEYAKTDMKGMEVYIIRRGWKCIRGILVRLVMHLFWGEIYKNL